MQTDANTDDFDFGLRYFDTPEIEAFWHLHEAPVRKWTAEMQAAGDLWWQSAKHAAFCLVSHREFEARNTGESPHWRDFDVEEFLFHDLHEGGTVGIFGSVSIFFEQLVEALERFIDTGIIDREAGERWLEEMRAARPRFLDHYRGCDAE